MPVRAFFLALSTLLFLGISGGYSKDSPFNSDTTVSKLGNAPDTVKAPSGAERLLKGYNVGYRVIESLPESENGSSVLAIWYPSSSSPEPFPYILGENRVQSNLSVDGPILDGEFPLVFYAHGASGSGLSSFFLCEALARNGYIVVAPDFSDQAYASRIDRPVVDSKERIKKIWAFIDSLVEKGLNKDAAAGRYEYAYRPEQLLASIKRIRALHENKDSFLFGHVKSGSIGLVGHSMGAWTALLVAGAAPRYRSPVSVAATIALSGPSNPYVFKVASENDLALIKCPLLFQYGDREKIFPDRQDRRFNYEKASPARPRVLACIADCNHFDFSCGSGKAFGIASDYIEKSDQRRCLTGLTLDFLDVYMKNKAIPRILLEKSPGVASIESNLKNKFVGISSSKSLHRFHH